MKVKDSTLVTKFLHKWNASILLATNAPAFEPLRRFGDVASKMLAFREYKN